jgi:hypothetical protein
MKTKSAKKATPFGIVLFIVCWILVGCGGSSSAPATAVSVSTPAPAHSKAYNDLMTWKSDGGYAALQVVGADLQHLGNPANISPSQYSATMRAIQAAKVLPLPASVDPHHQYTKALRQLGAGFTMLENGGILAGVAQLELGTATMLDVKSQVDKVKAAG